MSESYEVILAKYKKTSTEYLRSKLFKAGFVTNDVYGLCLEYLMNECLALKGYGTNILRQLEPVSVAQTVHTSHSELVLLIQTLVNEQEADKDRF